MNMRGLSKWSALGFVGLIGCNGGAPLGVEASDNEGEATQSGGSSSQASTRGSSANAGGSGAIGSSVGDDTASTEIKTEDPPRSAGGATQTSGSASGSGGSGDSSSEIPAAGGTAPMSGSSPDNGGSSGASYPPSSGLGGATNTDSSGVGSATQSSSSSGVGSASHSYPSSSSGLGGASTSSGVGGNVAIGGSDSSIGSTPVGGTSSKYESSSPEGGSAQVGGASSKYESSSPEGGSSSVGGASVTGGSGSGVSSSVGGASASGGTGSSDLSSVGGASATGGSGSGVSSPVGGASATGGSGSSDSSSVGGASAIGGSGSGVWSPVGGASASGGSGSGVSSSIGGASATGGSSSTGELPSTGGASASGGSSSTGGSPSTCVISEIERINVIVLNDAAPSTADVEGQMWVGHDATFPNTGFSVNSTNDAASKLSCAEYGFVAGGDLRGKLVLGSGSAAYAGTWSGAFHSNASPACGIVRGAPVDFDHLGMTVSNYSALLRDHVPNGTVKLTYASLLLSGKSTTLNVFQVTAAQLAVAREIRFDAPAGSSILVNVAGNAVTWQNAGFRMPDGGSSCRGRSSDWCHRILYNLYEAESLTLQSIGVQGSILAPLATVDGSAGNIDGQLVCENLYGGLEYHPYFFSGCLELKP